MSLSPSFPQGAPTLAEVLLQRTFAKPPQPFVDGEFLEALEHANDQPAATVALSAPAKSGDATGSGSESDGGSAPSGTSTTPRSSDGGGSGRSIDVRV